MSLKLPANYATMTWQERKACREEYVRRQGGKCKHCNEPLSGPPPKEITNKPLVMQAFPPNFLNNPVHLHHNHKTGMTIGAVHAYCNGVLWQYHGE